MPAAPAISALRRGEAGRAGSDVRSDLHVSFEEHTSGGIQIDLRSRVNLYYGERIRQQISEVVRSLGVEHAQLTVVDEGALPFMIAARDRHAAHHQEDEAGEVERGVDRRMQLRPGHARPDTTIVANKIGM